MAQWWHYQELDVPQIEGEKETSQESIQEACSNIKGAVGISDRHRLCTWQLSPIIVRGLGYGLGGQTFSQEKHPSTAKFSKNVHEVSQKHVGKCVIVLWNFWPILPKGMFHVKTTLHFTQRTPYPHWSTKGGGSSSRSFFLLLELGPRSRWRGLWTAPNSSQFWHLLERWRPPQWPKAWLHQKKFKVLQWPRPESNWTSVGWPKEGCAQKILAIWNIQRFCCGQILLSQDVLYLDSYPNGLAVINSKDASTKY